MNSATASGAARAMRSFIHTSASPNSLAFFTTTALRAGGGEPQIKISVINTSRHMFTAMNRSMEKGSRLTPSHKSLAFFFTKAALKGGAAQLSVIIIRPGMPGVKDEAIPRLYLP